MAAGSGGSGGGAMCTLHVRALTRSVTRLAFLSVRQGSGRCTVRAMLRLHNSVDGSRPSLKVARELV